jgi:hypothetical protein
MFSVFVNMFYVDVYKYKSKSYKPKTSWTTLKMIIVADIYIMPSCCVFI